MSTSNDLSEVRDALLQLTFERFWIQAKNSHENDEIPFRSPRKSSKNHFQTIGMLIVVAFILLLSLPFLIRSETFAKHFRHQCSSSACLSASHRIVENLNREENPCENFFAFVCDGWQRKHLLSPSETSNNYFKEISQSNSIILMKILDDESTNSTLKTTMKMKIFFRSCFDRNSNEDFHCEFFHRIPFSILFAHQHGIDSLFRMSVTVDEKDNQIHRIIFEPSSLSFDDRSLYENDEFRLLFNQFGDALFDICHSSHHVSIDEIFQFEKRLSKFYPKKSSRNPWRSYHIFTLDEIVNEYFHWFDMNDYLEKIFHRQKNFFVNQTFLISHPDFFRSLSMLIDETPRHIVTNYIAFRIINEFLPYLPERFENIRKPLLKFVKGINEEKARWQICVKRTDEAFGFATGALFIRKMFDVKNKEIIEKILEEIRQTFLEILSKIDWMDDQTRSQAALKAKLMLNRLGYPKWLEDEKKIDEFYEKLHLSSTNNSLENFLSIRKFQRDRNLKKLGRKPDIEEWTMTPIDVNAYYAPWKNMIVFPAGILQAPFFDPNVPIALNFGSIGSIIGHELIHAFDASGRFFDAKGNLNDWWQSEAAEEFDQRARCFIDQYNRYVVGKRHLNGILTLDENIADNGGVRIAYTAYRRYIQRRHFSSEQILPGLNFTDEQLFFVGFAQTWCMKTTRQAAETALITDPHANPKYRVIGSLSNMIEFARAFQCSVGSPMNPIDRCEIWSN